MDEIKTFAFMDLEATGLGLCPKITELSVVAVHRQSLIESRHNLKALPRVLNKLTVCVYPMKPVEPTAADMTGLHCDNLFWQKDFDESLADMLLLFLQRLDSPVCFIAHNGNSFDYGLLKTELQKLGKTLPDNVKCADSLELFRALDNPENHMKMCSKCKKNQYQDKLSDLSSKPASSELNEMQLINEITPELQAFKSVQQGGSLKAGGGLKRKVGDSLSAAQSWEAVHKARRKLFPDVSESESSNHCNQEGNSNSSDQITPEKDDLVAAPVPSLSAQSSSESSVAGQSGNIDEIQNASVANNGDKGADSEHHEALETLEYWADIMGEFDEEMTEGESSNDGSTKQEPKSESGEPSNVAPELAFKVAQDGAFDQQKQINIKPKLSYKLEEVHKRIVGRYPKGAHRAEDDCIALLRIFQRKTEEVCLWVDQHAVPFSTMTPLYKHKNGKPLPVGTFPYQI